MDANATTSGMSLRFIFEMTVPNPTLRLGYSFLRANNLLSVSMSFSKFPFTPRSSSCLCPTPS